MMTEERREHIREFDRNTFAASSGKSHAIRELLAEVDRTAAHDDLLAACEDSLSRCRACSGTGKYWKLGTELVDGGYLICRPCVAARAAIVRAKAAQAQARQGSCLKSSR